MQFLTSKQIIVRYPNLSDSTLRNWARLRVVKAKMITRAKRGYCLADVAKLEERRKPASLMEFRDPAGNQWIAAELVQQQFGISLASVQKWRKDGIPILDGEKLRCRIERIAGGIGKREFVSVEQLVAARDALAQPGEIDEHGWHSIEQAQNDFQMDRQFLLRWHRCPHPLLKRKIRRKTKRVAVFTRTNRVARQCFYLTHDLRELYRKLQDHARSDSDQWILAAEAKERGFGLSILVYWHQHGCNYLGGRKLRARRRDVTLPTKRTKSVWEFHADDLSEIEKHKKDQHFFRDEQGQLWLAQSTASEVYEIPPHYLVRWRKRIRPCTELDGRPIRARKAPLPLFRTKHGRLAWVYSDEDLRQIYAKRKGWSSPAGHPMPSFPDDLRATIGDIHKNTLAVPAIQEHVIAHRAESAQRYTEIRAREGAAASKPAEKNAAEKQYADWFQDKCGLQPNTLNKARRDGRLKKCDKPAGRWLYDVEEVFSIYPDSRIKSDEA